jgi:amidohydrolase
MADPQTEQRLAAALDRVAPQLVEDRRHLHRHPELSYHEQATAEMCAERCEVLGFTVRTVVDGTGVVADLDSGRPGPTVMLRADTDALPITERGTDGRAVTSENQGAMHACGHDGHVAMALGAAAALADLRDAWSGRLRMCFQPAEEVAGGAQPMIDAGAADGVDRVLGIHLWAPLQVGRVAVGPGPLFGSADEFGLVVRGRGGHGGMPHTSVDPVVCAAQIVTALQTVVSRETSPFSPAVITIGRIEGGSAFNVIAEEVRLRGTVRAFEAAERERLLQRIAELSAALATSMRCEAEFTRANGCPPVVSDAQVAQTVRRAAVATVGEANVDPAPRVTVGDDVALFLERAPGCYFLVGAGDVARRAVAPHHHPEFDIDERCLPVGAATLARAALLEFAATR